MIRTYVERQDAYIVAACVDATFGPAFDVAHHKIVDELAAFVRNTDFALSDSSAQKLHVVESISTRL